ncbi:MAG: NAD(P)H-dependent oxidoreductase [Acidobacteria bacterium]|nr:NAD(P)H-dependent oxidoreductase [Acidobacteriota bacterium]MCZ6492002.1 NAD(P)H-dependent oxidoreductase [Acidobacteriota bacterium]MCZ6752077.1 NAD(P)H-dependent oxidoreductase [Acidobacteriota bacterium]
MEKERIRIVAAVGSVRPGNFTLKAMNLVLDEMGRHRDVETQLIDPAKLKMALPGTAQDNSTMEALQKMVAEATGVILATPEYHGSYSSVIKLVIEHLGFPSVLSGKPVALLGVAAGSIGAIKALEHLRSVCSHVGAIVLPGPVSVAAVHKVFDDQGRCLDPGIEKRIRGVATNLVDYIRNTVCPRVALEQMVRADSK